MPVKNKKIYQGSVSLGDKSRRHTFGFTLVEIMVAVSIFTIVALAVSGAFVTLANIFRKVQTSRAVIDNINLAMDLMALQIREGQNYSFDGSCSESIDGRDCFEKIIFDEYVITDSAYIPNRQISYESQIENDRGHIIQCAVNLDSEGQPEESLNDPDNCSRLTSEEVDIHFLRFYAVDASEPSPLPVTIIVDGTAFNTQTLLESNFTLQTSLVRRNYRN